MTLYPVETAKVHIQAGRSKEVTLATMKAIVRDEQSVLALFKGLPAKSVHVITNNYIYFYIYEWLKAYRAKLAEPLLIGNKLEGTAMDPYGVGRAIRQVMETSARYTSPVQFHEPKG